MKKGLLNICFILIKLIAFSQVVEIKTGVYNIRLSPIDTLSYFEYPLKTIENQGLSKPDFRVSKFKYSYGLITGKNDKIIQETIVFKSKFYVAEDGTLQSPTSCLFLKPINSETFITRYRSIGKIEKHPFLTGYYYLFIDNMKFASGDGVFQLCNQLLSIDNSVSIIEPVFVKLIKTENPYRPSEWNINNNGTIPGSIAGADMGVENAWNYATGTGIRVAVIDDGVDISHPDLVNNLLPGYDATGNNSGGAPIPSNGHGTNCAGIIASTNNSIGTIGVAYNSRIIPLRMGIVSPGGSFNTNDTWISNCFYEAVMRGADVITNSWGGSSSSTQIDLAIQYAITNGRSGNGAVILFATGNHNSLVEYPATNDNVIAVGASTQCDTRKRSSSNPTQVGNGVTPDPAGVSCDGELTWGSNFGTYLDVVAPGVYITSTDNVGTGGFVVGDYFSRFNGTSAACPNAAAVVALILSARPSLTGRQARDILEQSCFKLPSLNFQSNVTGQPNGSWNNEVGYGRINADLAICRALNLCSGNVPTPDEYSFFCLPTFGKQTTYLKNGKVVFRSGDDEFIPVPGAVNARVNSPITCGGIPGEQHFYYIGVDDNIHDVYRRTVEQGWVSGNLAPSAICKPGTAIAADYANWSTNGNLTLPFVFYVNNDNYVCCLEYDGLNWQNTVFNFGQTIKEGSPMAMARQDGCPVLLYIGDDNKIHGYNKWNGKWYHIFPDPNGMKCRDNSPLVSGKYAKDGLLEDAHGFYIGEDNRIYTVWTVKHMGGNWRTDCIRPDIHVGLNSKLYFLRYINTDQSKLIYQQPNSMFSYLSAANGAWTNYPITSLPTNLKPDLGSPVTIGNNDIFYKTNGNLVRVQIF